MSDKYEALMKIGKSAASAIEEMVAALECDYDRLEELRDMDTAEFEADPELQAEAKELRDAAGECESREDAEQRIHEDALSVEVRSGWETLGGRDDGLQPAEFCILLTTGGPAVRIIGDLENGEISSPRLEVQDWGTPWTEYRQIERSTLEAYCNCFYFGDGAS